MFHQLTLFVVAAICLSGLTTAKSFDVVPQNQDLVKLQKYSDLLLLSSYTDTEFEEEILDNAKKWTYEESLNLYTNKEAVTEFWELYQQGFLPPNNLFSIFEYEHLQQAIALFKLFYYAPNLDSFIQAASWARVNVNQELFVYAYSIAILHRSDTVHINLVAPYQIFPNHFFNIDFLKSYTDRSLAIYKGNGVGKSLREPIWANYTNTYVSNTRDPETSLTYFFEDVGINTCYLYMHFLTPFWMSSSEFPISKERGELYLLIHKWIINRIAMEYSSVGSKPIEHLDWYTPIETGYEPTMIHSNGILFPQRKEGSYTPKVHSKDIEAILDYEKRVKEAIDFARAVGKDGKSVPLAENYKGIDKMINIVEGNADSLNFAYYGSIDQLGRKILGFGPERKDEHHVVPSALEGYATSIRDPAFYRLYHKIIDYTRKINKHVRPYTKQQVSSDHLSIKSFEVDDVITYFETYDTPVSNLFLPNRQPFTIKARQTRLNHKNFVYRFSVKSDKVLKARVRLFLIPRSSIDDKFTYNDAKKAYLVDYFVHEMAVGNNEFERKSTDTPFGLSDFQNYPWSEYTNKDSPPLGFLWPQRLLFPKGTADGLPAYFYVHITESIPAHVTLNPRDDIPWKKFDIDTMGYDFPFDKPMESYTKLPNTILYPIRIFHKDESEINFSD